jgi:predicted RNA-binding protein with PIN domain
LRILVDGHNAMGALRLRGDTHEALRDALLRRVAARAPGATVFFDAQQAPDVVFDFAKPHGLNVVYCRRREADEAILEEVRSAGRPHLVLVVTNDREVSGKARQLGAKTSRVREFFGAARDADPAPDREPFPPGGGPAYEPGDFGLPDQIDLDDPDFE